MAVITPNTDVILLKSPLELSDDNQLTFANATAQYNYFNSLPKRAFDHFTYQRKDGTISVPAAIDDIWQYNYVMYRNVNYAPNKWFYAFITGYQMESNGVTTISIKTDVYQTWMFELEVKQTFVEREHVNDDTMGAHTIPENLETGDFVFDFNVKFDLSPSNNFYVCFMLTKKPFDTAPMTYATWNIGGTFSGLFCVAVPLGFAKNMIELYNVSQGVTADAIVNAYMIPAECVDTDHKMDWSPTSSVNFWVYEVKEDVSTINTTNVVEHQNFQGYLPKNQKLLCWPYKYFHITNNAGTDVEYRWEDFPINGSGYRQADLTIKCTPSCGASSKLVFGEYKGYNSTTSGHHLLMNYGVNGCKLPTCAWTTDYYTNWLTQNGVNIATKVGLGIAGAAIGVATGGVGLAAAGLSTASTIASAVGQTHRAETTPPQAHGDTSNGDINFARQRSAFNVYGMSIRREYAEVIDKYFSMYGYKVNTVKVPNVTGRANWNYVKTVGCYLAGDIPQEDLAELKSMFDKGITFWHNPSTFCDYSQSNAIVS